MSLLGIYLPRWCEGGTTVCYVLIPIALIAGDVSIVSCALCLLCPTPESAVSSGVWCGEHLEVVHGFSPVASSVAES